MEIFLIHSKQITNKAQSIYKDIKNIVINDIHLLEFDLNLNGIDALIFTSKNAIDALIYNAYKKNNENWKKIDSFIFGESSANYFKKMGGIVKYKQIDGNGKDFALNIKPFLQNKKALYIRAKIIALDIKKILNNVDLKEIIAYESKMKYLDISLKPPSNSILIFTAPSTYKSFIANFGWDKSYIAIAIGKTTFKSFINNIKALKAPKQSIESCINLAKQIKGSFIE